MAHAIDHRDFLADLLWPWQKRFVSTDADRIVVNKSRHTGYTWAGQLKAVMHCLAHPDHTYFLCTTKVEKAVDELVAPIKRKILPGLADTDLGTLIQGCDLYSRKIVFSNGSEIKAASNDVDKLRGPTKASYLFDECASWEIRQHEALEEAILPIIRSQLNDHGEIRMVSTPKPTRNLYRQLCEETPEGWRYFETDIFEACECPDYPEDDPDQFRQDCATRDEWLQEYCCVFLDREGNYFDRQKLRELDPRPDHADDCEITTYLGVDIGRKNDQTAIVQTEEWSWDGTDYLHPSKLWIMDEVPFRLQRETIKMLIEGVDPRGVALDETAHPAMVEDIVEHFADPDADFSGEDVVGLLGDRERKADHTREIQEYVELGGLVLEPLEAYDFSQSGFVEQSSERHRIINDLCRVKETSTVQGRLRYEAPRDDEGHADSYSALLLAMAARDETQSRYIGSFG